MDEDAAHAAPRPLPAGVAIRVEGPDDWPGVAEVVASAFDSVAHADFAAALRASTGAIPELSLVAERDGSVVGHVRITYVGLVDGETRREVPSLSPLSVAPAHQAVGIGSALVREVLARAERRGEPLVVLEGDPRYYSRLGFEASVPHGIEIDLPSWASPGAAQLVRLAAYDPALRGRVAYPPAFDLVASE